MRSLIVSLCLCACSPTSTSFRSPLDGAGVGEDLEIGKDSGFPDIWSADTGVDSFLQPDQGTVLRPDIDPSHHEDSGAPADLGMPDTAPDLGVEPDSFVEPDAGQELDQSVEPDQAAEPDSFVEPDQGASGEWVTIPGGWYMQGAEASDACVSGQGKVNTFVRRFEMMRYEMTKRQRALLQPPQPWTDCSDPSTCPAARVSWLEAAKACNALSASRGYKECYSCFGSSCELLPSPCGYRLPTRAEFEYAYRAGTETEFYNGPASPTQCIGHTRADLIAWYDWNSDWHAHPVGLKDPNDWGLYDMAGNVAEWVEGDCLGGKTAMGGHWNSPSPGVQASVGSCIPGGSGSLQIGFRCVRSL